MGVTREIREHLRRAHQADVRALGQDILEAAARDAPPSPPPDLDPNEAITLREAGYVRDLPGGGVEVGFETSYAAKIHEDLRLEHPRGGGPKYLERNVAAAPAIAEGRLGAEVRKVMRAKRSAPASQRLDITRL